MTVIAECLGMLVITIIVIGIPFICGEIASICGEKLASEDDLKPIRNIFGLLFMADFIFIFWVIGILCM